MKGKVIGKVGSAHDHMSMQQVIGNVQKRVDDKTLKNLIFLGEFDNGELYVMSSSMTREHANFLIDRHKMYALGPEVVLNEYDVDETVLI